MYKVPAKPGTTLIIIFQIFIVGERGAEKMWSRVYRIIHAPQVQIPWKSTKQQLKI